MMITINTFEGPGDQGDQGDVHFAQVVSIPKNAKPVETEKGPLVIAHSETGHHHVFQDSKLAQLFTTDDPFVCYLQLSSAQELVHLRPWDTHAPILFPKGTYEMRRQREHTPEGYRMVQD